MDELESFVKFIKEKFDTLESVNTHVAPIHNDIRYSNILYDRGNKRVGVIDFGGCEVNDIDDVDILLHPYNIFKDEVKGFIDTPTFYLEGEKNDVITEKVAEAKKAKEPIS